MESFSDSSEALWESEYLKRAANFLLGAPFLIVELFMSIHAPPLELPYHFLSIIQTSPFIDNSIMQCLYYNIVRYTSLRSSSPSYLMLGVIDEYSNQSSRSRTHRCGRKMWMHGFFSKKEASASSLASILSSMSGSEKSFSWPTVPHFMGMRSGQWAEECR